MVVPSYPGMYLATIIPLEAFKEVFVHVVHLAGEAGLVKLGNVSTDGTKIQGDASRHKAMSYGYMHKEVKRLREEREAFVTAASQQDDAEDAVLGSRRGDGLPAELARREQRLVTIEAARRRLEAQAKAAAEAERQQRAAAKAERQRTGTPLKESRGFRRFLLRGLEKIRGAWRLVCLTHNLLKLWRYRCAPLAASPGEVPYYVYKMVLVEPSSSV